MRYASTLLGIAAAAVVAHCGGGDDQPSTRFPDDHSDVASPDNDPSQPSAPVEGDPSQPLGDDPPPDDGDPSPSDADPPPSDGDPSQPPTDNDPPPSDEGPVAPGPAPADVNLAVVVDATTHVRPISSLIYGTNTVAALAAADGALTLGRVSGNRYSTYNWETNASNAGAHTGHANDAELVDFTNPRPAAPVLNALERARTVGARVIVTVPMLGFVAADTLGVVDVGELGRFLPSLAHSPAGSALEPNTNDGVVYQDAFVAYVKGAHADTLGGLPRAMFCLDNEPELWSENVDRAHPEAPTYAEVIGKNIEYAKAIKDIWPESAVLGGVYYGWDGFVALQSAPDRFEHGYPAVPYLATYLDAMREAENSAGRRLIDALDVHWYPEARGDGQRVTVAAATPGLAAARMQAPRSLWDPTYVEESWITAKLGGPITFLPWINALITNHYPGTRLVISEYNYGGGAHISGAIATADALGLFGRHGVWAAALWELAGRGSHAAMYAAITMYRDFDGEGGRFGNTAVAVTASDTVMSSGYAAVDASAPDTVTVVLINKREVPARTWVGLTTPRAVTRATIYQLTSTQLTPAPAGEAAIHDNGHVIELPPLSVTTVVYSR